MPRCWVRLNLVAVVSFGTRRSDLRTSAVVLENSLIVTGKTVASFCGTLQDAVRTIPIGKAGTMLIGYARFSKTDSSQLCPA